MCVIIVRPVLKIKDCKCSKYSSTMCIFARLLTQVKLWVNWRASSFTIDPRFWCCSWLWDSSWQMLLSGAWAAGGLAGLPLSGQVWSSSADISAWRLCSCSQLELIIAYSFCQIIPLFVIFLIICNTLKVLANITVTDIKHEISSQE